MVVKIYSCEVRAFIAVTLKLALNEVSLFVPAAANFIKSGVPWADRGVRSRRTKAVNVTTGRNFLEQARALCLNEMD